MRFVGVTMTAPRIEDTEFEFGFYLLDTEGYVIRSETMKNFTRSNLEEGEEVNGAFGTVLNIPVSVHKIKLWFSVGDSMGSRTLTLPHRHYHLRLEMNAYDGEHNTTAVAKWSLCVACCLQSSPECRSFDNYGFRRSL